MADKVVELDDKKRRRMFVKKFEPGEFYSFSKLVRSLFIVKGEETARPTRLDFNSGIYVGFDEEINSLMFKGEPVVDPGGLGEGIFWVPLHLNIELRLVKNVSKKK
jgi:hypothetical protein